MALSTKILDDSNTSKVLQPGNHIVEIVNVKLESSPFKEGSYHINLTVQGPDLGKEFKGFFMDVNDESKGRYTGQTGRIRSSEYPYSDGVTKTGIKVYRDNEMMKFLKNLCIALEISQWFLDQDGKHDTIEQLVSQFDIDKPFISKKLKVCIGGREYQNKQGYTNYDLFFPKTNKVKYSYESANTPEESSKLLVFDAAVHVVKNKKKTETVTSFEKPITEATRNSFSLD